MSDWNPRAIEIFLAALDLSTSEEKRKLIDERCGHEADLRAEVESLLSASNSAGDFLNQPLVPPIPTLVSDEIKFDFLEESQSPDTLGRLGEYEVTKVIGRGGMGIVLEGLDTRLKRVVAIKVLAPELSSNSAARRRFLREAQSAAAVTHQQVVTIHAVNEAKLPYLVMEYVTGQSLQQKIDRDGPLPLTEILRIGSQIASGLAAAHAQGLIHRDIKPANILLENGVERVRITDFGLARAVDDATITKSGEVTGTPQYMSPEQAQGHAVDARSDLFSLGCVMYAMCTGRSPFRADSTIAAIRRVCDDTPRPIREVNSEVPQWLVNVIDRLLKKDPHDRLQTAAETADLLERCLAHTQNPRFAPLPVFESGSRPKRRVRGLIVAVALLIVGTVLLGEVTDLTDLSSVVRRDTTGHRSTQVEATKHVARMGGRRSVDDETSRLSENEITSIADIRRREAAHVLETASGESLPHESGMPFVVLASDNHTERGFDSLADAVAGSLTDDTIEIRGNGPFITDSFAIEHALTIRSATGFRPIIQLSEAAAATSGNMIHAVAPLRMEGLDLRRTTPASFNAGSGLYPKLVDMWTRWPLCLANCRLTLEKLDGSCIVLGASCPAYTFQNCEIYSNGRSAGCYLYDEGIYEIKNCIIKAESLSFRPVNRDIDKVTITLRNSTVVGHVLGLTLETRPDLRDLEAAGGTINVALSDNLVRIVNDDFKTRGILFVHQHAVENPLSAEEVDRLLPHLFRLRDERNVYNGAVADPLAPLVDWQLQRSTRARDIEGWLQMWEQAGNGSREGTIRFKGGDVKSRGFDDLTPDDFRLLPGSAGYRAGPEGKDLGADIDFVGPGAAYERWKQTPAYTQWLEETAQMMKAVVE